MKGERGPRAWVRSGQKSRFIDTYIKIDRYREKKAKERLRKNIDIDKAVERLLKILEE